MTQSETTWIIPLWSSIRKDFLPKDLLPILKENKIDGCIAVQADQSETETEFLLQCAEKNPFIKGRCRLGRSYMPTI